MAYRSRMELEEGVEALERKSTDAGLFQFHALVFMLGSHFNDGDAPRARCDRQRH